MTRNSFIYLVLGLTASLPPAPLAAQTAPRFLISPIAGVSAEDDVTYYTDADTNIGHGIGDDGLATAAQLRSPCGLTIDTARNIYFTDTAHQRIRKIDVDGVITTIGGTGSAGYYGNGILATDSQVSSPCGISLDWGGSLFFADTGSHTIRKLVDGGNMILVAGDQNQGYHGDADLMADDQYTMLDKPSAVVVGTNNVIYIADTGNNRIRIIDTEGYIQKYAGNGFAGRSGDGIAALDASLNAPRALALDANGNLYIADTGSHMIRMVTSDGIIHTVAGTGAAGFSGDGGSALNAELNSPQGMAFDTAGNLYFADTLNNRIRMITTEGIIWTIAGSGTHGDSGQWVVATDALLNFPSDVHVGPDGNIYFIDAQNNRIKMLSPIDADSTVVPTINTGGVIQSTAFGASSTITPGGWIEIYGSSLASKTRQWTTEDFSGVQAPTGLEDTRVRIGGVLCFIEYISPKQVNVQVPLNVATGTQKLTVATANGSSAVYSATVAVTQPGLNAPASFKLNGLQYVRAFLPDASTYVLPAGAISSVTSRPAKPGETITMYGIGFGQVTPYQNAGEIVDGLHTLEGTLKVFFDGVPATVAFAGLAPGTVGLYQINVVVPAMPDNTAARLTLTLDGTAGTQVLYTAVKN
jgi:uncharacterized protein (TIGR03437 family)